MRLWALALILSCLAASQPAAAASPPTIDRYAHAVHRLRGALDRLAGSPSVSPTTIATVRRELGTLHAVRLPDGRVLSTEMPLLATQLASDSGSRHAVAVQLDALDDGLRTLPRRPANGPALHTLDVVLRDPRFHPGCRPVACVEDWIAGLLRPLLRQVNVSPPSLPAWPFAIVFLLLVLAVAALTFRGALARTVSTVLPIAAPADMRRAASLAQAKELAAAGEYRAALHYLFLATMITLHEQNGVDLRPGLTNRELLDAASAFDRTLAGASARREALRELVDEFDRAWYGHLPFGGAEYARCERLARQVLDAEGRDAA